MVRWQQSGVSPPDLWKLHAQSMDRMVGYQAHLRVNDWSDPNLQSLSLYVRKVDEHETLVKPFLDETKRELNGLWVLKTQSLYLQKCRKEGPRLHIWERYTFVTTIKEANMANKREPHSCMCLCFCEFEGYTPTCSDKVGGTIWMDLYGAGIYNTKLLLTVPT